MVTLFSDLCVSNEGIIIISKNVLYVCQLVVFLKGCGDEYGSIHTKRILLQANDVNHRLDRRMSTLGFSTHSTDTQSCQRNQLLLFRLLPVAPVYHWGAA